jgi:peptide deformylase
LAVHDIVTIGNPILRKRAEDVDLSRVKKRNFKRLIKDMFDTMNKYSGVGLAGPQIGISLRFFIMGFDNTSRYPDENPIEKRIIINPEIKFLTDQTADFWEGCLSIPDMQGLVRRPEKIEVKYFDEDANLQKKILTEFEAIVFQHEYDHLDGILYIDKLVSIKQFGFTANYNNETSSNIV